MADRYFPNEMPDFVDESAEAAAAAAAAAADPTESSLSKLLRLPYPKASDNFLRAALQLKEKIVKETWIPHGPGRGPRDWTLYTGARGPMDWTLYTGALGTAFLLFKSFLVTNDARDLTLSADIVSSCHSASRGSSSQVTFICGRAGVCALGAVVAKYSGDKESLNYYLSSFKEIKLPDELPNELLYGRAGYLWTCSFLNTHIGEGTIPSTTTGAIAKEIIKRGKHLSNKSSCPLMYEWHGKMYWGAAHGLAGIMHALVDVKLNHEEQELVKGTLRYMINNRFPSGNYPSSEGSESDRLVHWCHGAPGVALTLANAAKVFGDELFLRAAEEAAVVVWNRGLLKRVGICHGVSGNAYVFLSLYRLTGRAEYLYKAKAFASFLMDRADQLISEGKMHGGDRPYSLFEGLGGMAYLFLDMVQPSKSSFPAYNL